MFGSSSPQEIKFRLINDAIFLVLAIVFSWSFLDLVTLNFANAALQAFFLIFLWSYVKVSKFSFTEFNGTRLLWYGFISLLLYLFLLINYAPIFIVANNFETTNADTQIYEVFPYLKEVAIGIVFIFLRYIVTFLKDFFKNPSTKERDEILKNRVVRIVFHTFFTMFLLTVGYIFHGFTGLDGNITVLAILIAKLYYDFLHYKRLTI